MESRLDNLPLKDRREILTSYRNLLRSSAGILQWADVRQIRKAIELSMQKSGFERHASGKLAIVHSLEVGRITVEEVGLGKTSLICALLYEIVRQSGASIDEIREEFGDQEANILDGLIKVFNLYQTNASIQSENFRKLLLTFAQDVRVILILLADRLHTMRSLGSYSREAQQTISSEVSYLYAPMAHRLGLYTIKSEMEDLVMKFTDREMYSFIAKKLKRNQTRQR